MRRKIVVNDLISLTGRSRSKIWQREVSKSILKSISKGHREKLACRLKFSKDIYGEVLTLSEYFCQEIQRSWQRNVRLLKCYCCKQIIAMYCQYFESGE